MTDITDVIDVLYSLLEDSSLKVKVQLESIIKLLESDLDEETLIKIQDKLEILCDISSIDSYTRSEIYNVLSVIDSLI